MLASFIFVYIKNLQMRRKIRKNILEASSISNGIGDNAMPSFCCMNIFYLMVGTGSQQCNPSSTTPSTDRGQSSAQTCSHISSSACPGYCPRIKNRYGGGGGVRYTLRYGLALYCGYAARCNSDAIKKVCHFRRFKFLKNVLWEIFMMHNLIDLQTIF